MWTDEVGDVLTVAYATDTSQATEELLLRFWTERFVLGPES